MHKSVETLLDEITIILEIFLKKKKKRRMRILSACIFSKSFGGKIKQFSNRCYWEAIIK